MATETVDSANTKCEALRLRMLAAQQEVEAAQARLNAAQRAFGEARYDYLSEVDRESITASRDAERARKANEAAQEIERQKKRDELIEVIPNLKYV